MIFNRFWGLKPQKTIKNNQNNNLMKILESLDDNTNTFVISHKGEVLDGKFNSKIEFYKHKNFSQMK